MHGSEDSTSQARIRRAIAACSLAAFAACAPAEPVSRSVSITKIHPMAVQRTHCPSCSGITRIYVSPAAWGATSCRPDAGDLFHEDWHILTTLLMAWKSGKTVTLEVNSQVIPIHNDSVCKITAAFVE